MATKTSTPKNIGDERFKPNEVPTPNFAGYPQTGTKTSGIKIRGTGAATKGTTARGPMA